MTHKCLKTEAMSKIEKVGNMRYFKLKKEKKRLKMKHPVTQHCSVFLLHLNCLE